MANWTGTYTITTPGTTLTGATATTATNTGATWPTGGNSLANMFIRILTGTGAGQTVKISSNTATVITVAAWTGGTPAAGSTYEIVLIFLDQDHLTASTTLSTNMITEIDNNATLLINGAFSLTFTTSCTVRWNKSETTLATVCSNNRAVAGGAGFWTGLIVPSTITITPNISFIRIQDATIPINITPSTALGSASTIHHIWVESASGASATIAGAALTVDVSLTNFFSRWCTVGTFLFSATTSTFKHIYDTCWQENNSAGGHRWNTGTQTQWITNCVFVNSIQTSLVDTTSTQEHRFSRNYIGGGLTNEVGTGSILGCNTLADAGNHNAFCNVTLTGDFIAPNNPGTLPTGNIRSDSNDIISKVPPTDLGLLFGIRSGTIRTSNNDFLAGNNSTTIDVIDTTASTTSTASHHQYQNLTATRTNPRSVRNYPLVINNVSVGTPTSSAVTITYDCQNGSASTQQSTVNVDSNSGQTVLSCATPTVFPIGSVVEIGYGTARAEVGRVASTSGVSITLESNLLFTHTAAQADVVSLQLRNFGMPFIQYGTTTGVYTMSTAIPDKDDWGLYYTGLKTIYNGATYTWKQTGHSITLSSLKPSTTYFARCYAYSLLGELIDQGAESTFTTASAAAGITASTYS